MPKHLIKISMLCAAVLMAGCETTGSQQADPNAVEAPSPKNPDFAGEMSKFDAQFPNAKATKYENESIAFNNERKLDQKGNCHGKSKYPVTIVLILDAEGKVTKTMTDVENAKAACFRSAYAGVQFPRPPMAPYRKAILLK
ncbi:MAG TPA: hypothetical protein VF800_21845 [Telluria sp.]